MAPGNWQNQFNFIGFLMKVFEEYEVQEQVAKF